MKKLCLAAACLLAFNAAVFAAHNFTFNGQKTAYIDDRTDSVRLRFEFEQPGACSRIWLFEDFTGNGAIDEGWDFTEGKKPGPCDGLSPEDEERNGVFTYSMPAHWWTYGGKSFVWVIEDNGVRDTAALVYRQAPTNNSLSIQLPLPIEGMRIGIVRTWGNYVNISASNSTGRIHAHIPDSLAGKPYRYQWRTPTGRWSAPNHVVALPNTTFTIRGHMEGPAVKMDPADAWVSGTFRYPDDSPVKSSALFAVIGTQARASDIPLRSQVLANADGTYKLPVTANSRWNVKICSQEYEDFRIFAQSRAYTLRQGQVLKNNDFVVYPKDACLAGKVTRKGEPVAGRRVDIRYIGMSGNQLMSYYPTARTDENGEYRIRVPSGIDKFGHYEVSVAYSKGAVSVPEKYESVKSGREDLDFEMVDRSGITRKEASASPNFELFQNKPNPFNPTTSIRYSIPNSNSRSVKVFLAVFSANGRKIKTLVSMAKTPGTHFAAWDGKDAHGLPCPSGMYFYRLEAGDFTAVKRMLMVK